MKKQDKIYKKIEDHINDLVEELKSMDAGVVFDDKAFDHLIVDPSYSVMNASVSGLTIFLPEAKKKYEKICYTIRDNALEVDGNRIIIKLNGEEEIKKAIQENINPTSMAKGVSRYFLNILMGVIFWISYLLMFLMTWIYTKDLSNPPYIPLVVAIACMLISWGILLTKYKMGFKLPFASENDRLMHIFLLLIILPTCAIPLFAIGDWAINIFIPLLILCTLTIIFIKLARSNIFTESKYEQKSVLLKRLSYALVGFVLMVAYQMFNVAGSGDLISALIYGYITGAIFIGLFVMKKQMQKSRDIIPLGDFATQEEVKREEVADRQERDQAYIEDRMYNHSLDGHITKTKNFNARLNRLFFYAFWLVFSGVIGALLIPYYTFLVLKSRNIVIDKDSTKVTS